MSRVYHLHLVSDATGETLLAVTGAVSAQFEDTDPHEHIYALVRSEKQLARAIEQIEALPGIVFFTLVNPQLRRTLEESCARMKIPCLSILDKPVEALGHFLGLAESHRPGGQHEVDSRYMERVEAVNYAIQHDDGQATQNLDIADVILVGPSRTSKTPTCVYLAIRGVRAANVPLVPGVDPPPALFTLQKPLIVGLWASPERLMQVRRNRLATMGETKSTDYVDEEAVRAEIAHSKRLFERQDWPSIDVSRRSIEETAATILNMIADRGQTP